MRGVVLVLVLILAGCAGTGEVAQIRRMQPRGSGFHETLGREYRNFALQRANNGSWMAAAHFAAKGLDALAGRNPEPEPVDPGLPAGLGGELQQARAELLESFAQGARERFPPFAAIALARYDCWAERSVAWPEGVEARRCRQEFKENLNTLQEALARH